MGFVKAVKSLSNAWHSGREKRLNRKIKNRESRVKTAKGYADAYGKWKAAKEGKWSYKARTAKATQAGRTIRSLGRSAASMQMSRNEASQNMLATALGQEYKDNRKGSGSTGTGVNTTSSEDDTLATSYERGNRV